jgi:spoIIIJ-associated protein
MSTNRIFEGKDLAEALALASEQLGIAEPELDYEIVEQGRRGLFGLGAKSVQIRVMPPIDAETRSAGHGELAGQVPRGEGRRRGRGGRGRRDRGDTVPPNRPPARRARKVDADPRPEREPAPEAPQESVDQVRASVEKMIDLLGLDLEVSAKGISGGTQVSIEGADQHLLTDGDAEAVGAWQFLLNRMSRRAFPEAGRIQVYCNGHHQSRDEDLTELARETAETVLQDGRPQRLRPMNSYERRIVHMTVRKMRGVDSRSEGNGPLKRVRVFKRRRRRRPPRNKDAG